MLIEIIHLKYVICALVAIILHQTRPFSAQAICELSYIDGPKLYNFSLLSPIPKFPHGILSEDGFYMVTENESMVWFQPCDRMIFNHNPPKCINCMDCGGPSRCGMACSALVATNLEGYDVCTTVGHVSNINTNILDDQNPHKGVVVRMSSNNSIRNCSLSVSIICDSNEVKGPHSLEKMGNCDYAVALHHPSGCATIISINGSGWGWIRIFIIMIIVIFGGYILGGSLYRYFLLQVRGLDVIPNLDFWVKLPLRTQGLFVSMIQKIKGPSERYRNSYSPINF